MARTEPVGTCGYFGRLVAPWPWPGLPLPAPRPVVAVAVGLVVGVVEVVGVPADGDRGGVVDGVAEVDADAPGDVRSALAPEAADESPGVASAAPAVEPPAEAVGSGDADAPRPSPSLRPEGEEPPDGPESNSPTTTAPRTTTLFLVYFAIDPVRQLLGVK
ncbi:hypothetical protein ABZ656_33105 [Streptomyces sp. NPDC007095]|uniref:hypothetical protein n=1 Tax=Streptomyces sp. NPDC007095 TaxID=3154482 RepID=UPI0033D23332